ncbi:MAG: hypothetical protein ACKO85_06345 [Isosphaeraceae bacterium]
MNRNSNSASGKRLPARAWLIFGLTVALVLLSLGLRLAGFSLDRKSRILIDGPMLTGVALSSLIFATYRLASAAQTPQKEN